MFFFSQNMSLFPSFLIKKTHIFWLCYESTVNFYITDTVFKKSQSNLQRHDRRIEICYTSPVIIEKEEGKIMLMSTFLFHSRNKIGVCLCLVPIVWDVVTLSVKCVSFDVRSLINVLMLESHEFFFGTFQSSKVTQPPNCGESRVAFRRDYIYN